MQIAITARDDGGRIGTDDLRVWLGKQRELRGRVRRGSGEGPARGTMGTVTDVVTVLLEPGGIVTVLVAAVVTWVQNRSGNQTVTITRPDGTAITVTSERVKGLDALTAGALAQEIAGQLGVPLQRREQHAPGEAAEPGQGAAPGEGAESSERIERAGRAEVTGTAGGADEPGEPGADAPDGPGAAGPAERPEGPEGGGPRP
ncbi:hypothetical protein [Streptomyces sp. NPDC097619]|uniref:effector-associated constant component EACC1 n=1 Tax=Streptomyces sp. NPDC097619 TaxID=3157228 RepID=UPI00331CA684